MPKQNLNLAMKDRRPTDNVKGKKGGNETKDREKISQASNVSKQIGGKTKYILYYFGKVKGWNPHKYIDLSQCQVSDCVLTTNEKILKSSGDFDAVVVGHPLYDIVRDGTG